MTRLAAEDVSSVVVAQHCLLADLLVEEAAEALERSRATAFREWA